MLDILNYLPSRRKKSVSGWISFDAPCCVHNGESADHRQRGGIKPSEDGWSYNCFNCGYTASFRAGRALGVKARRLLTWFNVPQEEIERINLESLRHRSITGILEQRQHTWNRIAQLPQFEEIDLPADIHKITPEKFPDQWQYLCDRAVPQNYPCMTFAGDRYFRRPCVIVPFTHYQQIVGHSMRFLDGRRPRYITEKQPDYVFGWDLQLPGWQHVLVMEGVFDALCIGGMAVLHADISDGQSRLIRSLSREITVVPDQDLAGMRLVDRALELGWAVSMPAWPPGVKDVNDAVKRYGRLGTLLTIMQARETSRIKIELRRKQLAQRLQR
jgi:hypothetical protein